jgi:N-acetylglucosamine-6-sulfatase
LHRLDALLLVLKSCKGQSCVELWKEFHPDASEEVRTLADAMDVRYDWFYASMHAEGAKVAFRECKAGYLKEVEGPDYGSLDLKGLGWGGDGDRVEENGEEEELTFEKY